MTVEETVLEIVEGHAEGTEAMTERSDVLRCSAPLVQTVEILAKYPSDLPTENPFTAEAVFKIKTMPLQNLQERASILPALKNSAEETTNASSMPNAACAEWIAKCPSNPCQDALCTAEPA